MINRRVVVEFDDDDLETLLGWRTSSLANRSMRLTRQ